MFGIGEKKGVPGQKKEKKGVGGMDLSLPKGNSSFMWFFLGGILIAGGIYFYFQIKEERSIIKRDLDTLTAEMATLQPYLSSSKQENIIGEFPLYIKPDKDYLEKEDWEMATEIRDLASVNNVVVIGYETSDEKTDKKSSGKLMTIKGRMGSFTAVGEYSDTLNFLKAVEESDRIAVFNNLSFASDNVSVGGEEADPFGGFGALNTAEIEITYYYVESTIASSKKRNTGSSQTSQTNDSSDSSSNSE